MNNLKKDNWVEEMFYKTVDDLKNEAEKRKHLNRSKGGLLGGAMGGLMGSFVGIIGSIVGAAIGAGLGSFIGKKNDDN